MAMGGRFRGKEPRALYLDHVYRNMSRRERNFSEDASSVLHLKLKMCDTLVPQHECSSAWRNGRNYRGIRSFLKTLDFHFLSPIGVPARHLGFRVLLGCQERRRSAGG